MSRNRWLRCKRPIPVGYHAGYAYGLVHASTSGERIPSATGTAVRTDGRPVAHVRIGENGSQHPSPGQRTGEANRESPGRRLVRADANCIPISRVFLARLSEVPRRPRGNEPEERQDHGGASGRHEKAHGLPSTSCESDRDVGM